MAGGRRLAAVMFTDIVGFTSLTQRDESSALRLLDVHRSVLRPIFARFAGQEIKTIGDSFLVEFASALEATECAVEVQRKLTSRNRSMDLEPIEIRIGIHLGDVVHTGNDIYGDAVNIASRIEPLAEASGICVSRPVMEQVQNKVPFTFTPLEHAFLKNVESSFSVYSIDLPWITPPAARVTPWTDRESEVRALRQVLEDGLAGRGRIVEVSGEPGIGKTRLSEQAIREAEKKRFRILRSRCHQYEQPLPYSLWVQLARDFARDAPGPLLYKVCSGCETQIGRLVPEIGELLRVSPSAEGDSEEARLRLFEGVARFFVNLSREAPLLILMDDLQWADPDSLRILGYLAEPCRSQRVVLLLACRAGTDEENSVLKQVVDDLAHSPAFVRIPLNRMEGRPVSDLVGAVLGTSEPPGELVTVAQQRTGGNPLFVEELFRSLIEEHQLVRVGSTWDASSVSKIEVPSTLREVTLKRVSRAGVDAQRILSVAAVLGAEFEFELLRDVNGEDPDRLLTTVESLLRARLLREREVSPGSSVLAFADDQTREVLYQDLSLVRRREYHLKTARALESRNSGSQRELAGELALHYYHGGDPAKARDWTIVAARNAIKVYARDQATAHLRRALKILETAPDDRARAEVLEQLGNELEMLGQYEESSEQRILASEVYERLGDCRRAGSVLRLAAVRSRWTQLGEFSVDENRLIHARQLLESIPASPELARLYLDYAAYLRGAGRLDESRSLKAKALEVAVAVGDAVIEARVRLDLALELPIGSRLEVERSIDRAIELGKVHDPSVAIEAIFRRAYYATTGTAELKTAEEWIEKGVEYARAIHSPDWEAGIVGGLGSFTRIWLGDFRESIRRAEEYRQFLEAHGRKDAHNLLHLFVGPAVRGDFETANQFLAQAKAVLGTEQAWYQDAWVNFCSGWLESLRGNPALAEVGYRRALEVDRLRGGTEFDSFRPVWFLSRAIESAVQQGNLDRAERDVAELEALAGQVSGEAARAYLFRAQAQCAMAAGEHAKGAELLERGIEVWRRLGWNYELAMDLRDWAAAKFRMCEGDAARPAIEEAIRLFREADDLVDLDRALRVLRERSGQSAESDP